MKLPIGCSDFQKLIDEQYYFVDKTSLIADVIEDGEVALITRPRRFGKTLNLSMLRYFFELNKKSRAHLFNKFEIGKNKTLCQKHQGKYPVIFLTFKDIKESSYESAYEKIVQLIAKVYDSFSNILLKSSKLTQFQKIYIEKILGKQVSQAELEDSIFMLSQIFYNHYDERVVILIDEYDTTIQSGYLHGYYERIVNFFRNLLSPALKDNSYLFKAVLTGILRISKESLFSGMNNISVYSLLHPRYASYFGFTEQETLTLLSQAQLQQRAGDVKAWYNGYQFNKQILYNPWSILSFIQAEGSLKPYWVNTSDNQLVRKLLVDSSDFFKDKLEYLLQGGKIQRLIEEDFVFTEINKKNESAVWSLLLMAGYLKINSCAEDPANLCNLTIPNKEIRDLYRRIIEQWLSSGHDTDWYNNFMEKLLDGDISGFERDLQAILLQVMSYHDTSKTPETFYHGFMLGITANVYGRPNYEIKSNRESGYGRYDYMILSLDNSKPTILFEFKTVSSNWKKTINKAAEEALQQIEKQAYLAEAKERGVTNFLKIGLAFSGKRFAVSARSS